MREDLPDRPWLGDERDQPDIATTPRALQRKLLPHPSHEFGLRVGRCREIAVCRVSRSSRRWYLGPPSQGKFPK